MEDKVDILAQVKQYETINTSEIDKLQPIKDFLNSFDGAQLFNRNNFTGHITASAYIINPQKESLLLLKHKALNRWLQPGGHIDATDNSIVNAALREAEEETGIPATRLRLVSKDIFDVDSHTIPANEKKKEPEHVHHDISFLFLCNTSEIAIDEAESTASKWVTFSVLSNDADYDKVIKKIQCLNL
jgi:8-oxo-dGTP pyrophosphatase MutT (NUDIX family)